MYVALWQKHKKRKKKKERNNEKQKTKELHGSNLVKGINSFQLHNALCEKYFI